MYIFIFIYTQTYLYVYIYGIPDPHFKRFLEIVPKKLILDGRLKRQKGHATFADGRKACLFWCDVARPEDVTGAFGF